MLINLFKKQKRLHHEGDKVWVSHEQKLRGLCRIVQQSAASAKSVVVIAHFEQSFQEFAEIFKANKIAHESIMTIFDQSILRAQIAQPKMGKVILVLRDVLPSLPTEDQLMPASSSVFLRVISLERHFLRRYDEQIETWAASLLREASLEFHTALNEPLFRLFGGVTVAQLVNTLKLPDNECISSSVISKSIQQVQKKMKQKVAADARALSAEQWITLNLPDTKNKA